VLSTLHLHLDHDHCLEVIVVRGRAARVKKIADGLISMKGVKYGRLTTPLSRSSWVRSFGQGVLSATAGRGVRSDARRSDVLLGGAIEPGPAGGA
jgi:hypothetical protein